MHCHREKTVQILVEDGPPLAQMAVLHRCLAVIPFTSNQPDTHSDPENPSRILVRSPNDSKRKVGR
jgi:hypothetical protein